MRAQLYEVIANPNIQWDPDSNFDKWRDFYIQYYKEFIKDLVDLDINNLEFTRGSDCYRVCAPVKLDGYKDILLGGDVIFNDKTMENKYDYCNLGLLPILGNLQWAKKRIG